MGRNKKTVGKIKVNRFFVDGLDASGKSTLLERLKKEKLITKIEKETSKTNYDSFAKYTAGRFPKSIPMGYDRCCISEALFAPIFGRKEKLTWQTAMSWINKLCSSDMRTFLIVCVNSSEELFNSIHASRGETPEYSYARAKAAWDLFDIAMRSTWTRPIYIKYDIATMTQDDLIAKIKRVTHPTPRTFD